MTDTEAIRELLINWSENTRHDRKDQILSSHHPDLVIFDVLPPMKYESASAYRASWSDWQPETNGPGVFELQNLEITAGIDVAFAHALIRCGGTTPKGKSFEDLVRATFCLQKIDSRWHIMHQHVSKPYGQS